MPQMSFLPPEKRDAVDWTPSLEAAQVRLESFLPRAGKVYTRERNFDLGPENRENVSALSPWVRHRIILEEDIISQTLLRHPFAAAEKFIQEVFWRGYFKGWLEHRPEAWQRYKRNLVQQFDRMESDAALVGRYDLAVSGRTGIECFDTWANELVQTGYLHNHARMWFASIWIFTLKLPWELGADFFLRHLLDGDPAANTCSWRWVGGLHTQGKTYLARAENIDQFTKGRFDAAGQLATEAPSLMEPDLVFQPLKACISPDLTGLKTGLLITEEDCRPETLALPNRPSALFALATPTPRSILPLGQHAQAFTSAAVKSAAARSAEYFDLACTLCSEDAWEAAFTEWAHTEKLDCILTAQFPVGPVKTRIYKACERNKIHLVEISRAYDEAVWPHTRRSFFGLKEKMPSILKSLDLA